MEIDRTLQKQILLALKQAYPTGRITEWLYWFCIENKVLPFKTAEEIQQLIDESKDVETWHHFKDNIAYLIEHGLVVKCVVNNTEAIKSTVKGVDFITDDGGLSAILQRQEISLDEKSLKVISQALSQLDKPALQAFLSQLPSQLSGSLIQALLG